MNNETMRTPESEADEPSTREVAEFCKQHWQFPDDYCKEIEDSMGDFSAALATATIWAQELGIDIDEFMKSVTTAFFVG